MNGSPPNKVMKVMEAVTYPVFMGWLSFFASERDVDSVPTWFAIIFCAF
jgi:hypothetical protein